MEVKYIPSFPLNSRAWSEGEQQALQESGHTGPGGWERSGEKKVIPHLFHPRQCCSTLEMVPSDCQKHITDCSVDFSAHPELLVWLSNAELKLSNAKIASVYSPVRYVDQLLCESHILGRFLS